MSLDDYKVVLYRNQPDGWVAEVPSISGCYALMPTRNEALAELERVFEMIAAEYTERGHPLPSDTTEIFMPGARAEEFRRVAARLGFRKARQSGSHERWVHPDGRGVTIPIH